MEENEYKYKCVQCEFYTNIKPVYEKHLQTEKHKTGKRGIRSDKKYPEKCEECNYKPSGNTNYMQHKLNYHATKEERKEKFKYYCEKCDFGTFLKQIYETHTKTETEVKSEVTNHQQQKQKSR